MRLSRANFSDMVSQGETSQSHEAEPCVPGAQPSGIQALTSRSFSFSDPEGEFSRPTYQNYFFLAPNVRFTRTPDREIRKTRGEEEQTPVQGKTEAAPTADTTITTRASITRASITRDSTTSDRATRQAFAAERCVEPLHINAPAMRAPQARPSGRWAHISDHAFFEFLAANTLVSPVHPVVVSRVAAPAPAPVSTASFTQAAPAHPAPAGQGHVIPSAFQGADITTLYRVIECAVSAGSFDPQPVDAPASPQAEIAQADKGDAEKPASQLQAAVADAVAATVPRRSVEITMPAPRTPCLPMVGQTRQASVGMAYEFPAAELLQEAPEGQGYYMSQERLEQNADLLESVLEDFGVKGEIIHVRPGPVVTLYEFEPAPGVKSSRVINLAEDIARSMSAISARVAVVPGRNVIGVELPNETRETVYFREMIESADFQKSSAKLAVSLGKTIGGDPVVADLARMPHLLVAGTTGSGKSVAINTMILSLLYRLKPEECRLIMVDPKMLELSVYDGIPHLLTPVVTDPKKAVTALKWAVREMEDRYRKMAKLGVRNIDGYNQRAAAARDKGEIVLMQVQTGFEKGTGEPLFEEQEIDLAPMPYIVVIVDEMADLMMVAGKEIEGAIQRLAQMARAAGIHLIMATQRPSVDVITGTIKANFPTRISFQVTSKIDSRTILGEQGAEQLLGQGDMLHMAGGGRIVRVHGPFVSDDEVEQVVAHLKTQGRPDYLETVTADEDDEEPQADDSAVFDKSAMGSEDGDSLYDEAVKVVMRDKKCSTSYIQRRLGIGYNRAASLVERMEQEGLVGAANHVGKREILPDQKAL
ncbi:DNA translocase FtsK [Aquamicrobium segne]|uniref:DNA translocase FtsK n=1 Tax=Aquamicrobium segne TaxID=469547 RepID=A0ABW0GZ34_9HYPH